MCWHKLKLLTTLLSLEYPKLFNTETQIVISQIKTIFLFGLYVALSFKWTLFNPKPKTMKQKKLLAIAMAISVVFFSCSKDESSLGESADGTVQATATTPINYSTRVSIQHSAFTPADATIMVGGSILWANSDNVVHTVTADNGSFDSGDLQPEATFGFTFNVVGPHYYHCKYHEKTGVVKCVNK